MFIECFQREENPQLLYSFPQNSFRKVWSKIWDYVKKILLKKILAYTFSQNALLIKCNMAQCKYTHLCDSVLVGN